MGEHVERAGALADEVRRRLEARGDADAAGGEERDAVLADEPADRLGHVAGVGVLGEQNAQPAVELLVERGEEQRQRRLGDAGACRQRLGERGQALVGAQALDEGVEYRQVHDECPERGSGGGHGSPVRTCAGAGARTCTDRQEWRRRPARGFGARSRRAPS